MSRVLLEPYLLSLEQTKIIAIVLVKLNKGNTDDATHNRYTLFVKRTFNFWA